MNGKRKSALQSILLVGSGSLLAQGLSVLSIPVITRLFSPESYATWALFTSFIVVLGSVATLRYELAVVLPESQSEAANLFCLSVVLPILISIVALPFFFFFGKWFQRLESYRELAPWMVWTPLLIGASGLYQAAMAWGTRNKSFASLAISGVMLVVITTVSQILAGVIGVRTASGLILGTLVGQIAAAAILLGSILRHADGSIFSTVSPRSLLEVARKFKTYPIHMAPYTLLGVARERLILFFLGSDGNQSAIGHYAFAMRLANLPVSLVSGAIRPVLFQRATVSSARELEELVVRILEAMIRVLVPFWALFLFVAPDVFAFAFGEQWRAAGHYGVLLSFPSLFLLLANWTDRLFDARGRQALAFRLELAFSIASIGGFLGALGLTRSMETAILVLISVLTLYSVAWLYAVFLVGGFRLAQLRRVIVLLLRVALISVVSVQALMKIFGARWGVLFFIVGTLFYCFRAIRKELKRDSSREREETSLRGACQPILEGRT